MFYVRVALFLGNLTPSLESPNIAKLEHWSVRQRSGLLETEYPKSSGKMK